MENKKKHSAKAVQNARVNKIKARNQKIVQRRIAILIAVILLLVIAVVAIIKGSSLLDQMPDESLITIMDDGKVVCEEVTDFSDDTYSKSGLKDYIKKQIKEYTSENGADTVKLNKLSVKGDRAYAKITYASADDYSHFTSLGLYTGTIKKACKQGFNFSDTFVSVTDGVKGDSVDVLDITSQKKLKVAVIKENIDVTVDGTILYVSDACTTLVDESTVSIEQPDGNADATQLTYIIYK